MNQRKKPVLIGGFVVGFILLAIGAVVSLASGEFFQEKHKYVLFFEDSLQGLQVGAPVLWRGVEIGTVTDFAVTCNLGTYELRTPVYIETIHGRIRSAAEDHAPLQGEALEMLVEQGLRANLTSLSMVTGQMAVSLDIHPDAPLTMVGGDPSTTELPTIKTPGFGGLMEDARSALQGISALTQSEDLERAIRTLGDALDEYRKLGVSLNERVGPVLEDIQKTSSSARAMLDDVKTTSESVRTLVDDLKQTSGSARATFEQATSSVRGVEKSVHGVEESIASAETNLSETLRTITKLGTTVEGEVRPISKSFQATLERARVALDQVRATMKSVEGLTASGSPSVANLNMALRDFSEATRAIEQLAKTLERKPESLIRGK